MNKLIKKKIIILPLIFFTFYLFAKKIEAYYPNDPGVPYQWFLQQIRTPEAWDYATGSPEVVVAVIDSGVDIKHPDLVDNIWTNTDEIADDGLDNDHNGYVDDIHGWDFLTNSPNPSPKYTAADKGNILGVSHGTIISGIIAAKGNNKQGIAGITWHSKIMPIRILNNAGFGVSSNIVKGIDYAINNGADIINLSFIGMGKSSQIEKAVIRAYDAGLIVVAAAGNQSNEYSGNIVNLNKIPGAPICSASFLLDKRIVIGVASTDTLDQKSVFSNYGSDCVDISAPGYGFYSTIVNDPLIGSASDYGGLFSGTSLSTPLVSGAAALVKSVDLSLTNKQIINILLQSSDSIATVNPRYLFHLGKGRLNIEKAVLMAGKISQDDAQTIILKKQIRPRLTVTSNTNLTSKVWVYELVDTYSMQNNIFATYPFVFSGGLNSVMSKKTGDIYAIPGISGGPQLMRLDKKGKVRALKFVDNPFLRNGKNLALARFGRFGRENLLIGSGKGSDPVVKVTDTEGNTLKEFFAYGNNYRGGVVVAAGDLDGDGVDEILTGTNKGGGPQIRIFDSSGKFIHHFFAFDKKSRNGVKVEAGDITGNGVDEIIAMQGRGGIFNVKIFNIQGEELFEFSPFGKSYKGGGSIALADIDLDGHSEILVGSGWGLKPTVFVFDARGKLIYKFNPIMPNYFYGGINISVSK